MGMTTSRNVSRIAEKVGLYQLIMCVQTCLTGRGKLRLAKYFERIKVVTIITFSVINLYGSSLTVIILIPVYSSTGK